MDCKQHRLFLYLADDERHDVYLTLQQGMFGRGNKRADKNVQVDVEVLGERGIALPVSSKGKRMTRLSGEKMRDTEREKKRETDQKY